VRTRVKICGITRAEDAALAVRSGADAIGFVFWPRSPRAVKPAQVATITTDGALVARVGVFVDASPEEVAETVKEARLSVVQLHGDEPVGDFSRVGAAVIKAVSLVDERDVERALALPADVTVLIDAPDRQRKGGTGNVGDWSLARRVSRARPVILAGGLSAANVAAAIREVQPWGVDVSSGVEASPGIKEPGRLRDFFSAINSAEREEE
jgi:phosphoribosylanthranilate isomerase